MNMQEIECPLCGEYLVLNREGTMSNHKTGEFFYVLTCEECDQAFALDNETPKFIPYNADMKPIKNECKVCKIIKTFNEEGLFMLDIETGYYIFHCFDCSKPILQEWLNSEKNKTKITDKNIHEIYEIFDFNKNNEMLTQMREHPEKYKETMDKIKAEFDSLGKNLVGEKHE